MENIVLNLASGYVVTFKSSLTHGQQRELTKFLSAQMSVDAVKGEANTIINGAVLMEAQDLTLKLMLESIQKPDGTPVIGGEAYQLVQDMSDSDGSAVYAKLDEITKAGSLSEEDKKKLNSPSLNSSNPVEG